MPDSNATSPASCGATTTDRFCIRCGTALDGSARFCPRLGTPLTGTDAGGAAPAGLVPLPAQHGPWAFAIALSLVAVAGVIYSAIGRDGLPAGAPVMAQGDAPPPAGGGLPAGRAPDISGLTPREQFARLNDRVMAAAEAGDTSTVINFWPMAFGAYEQLPAADRDVDARYHMATLYLLVGQFPQVMALADTIITEAPDNLMTWYLRSLVAEFEGDSTRAQEARATFNRLFPAQIDQPRGEYIDHRDMLDAFRARTGAN